MNKTLRNLALVALAAAPFAAFADVVGSGTADDPWQMATAEDLLQANELVKTGQFNYFVQTADIDMTSVNDKWVPFVGKDASTYDIQVSYDGRNHVISNFAPAKSDWSYPYYAGSIFGVLEGEVKNLGIVDININAGGGRGAALAGYCGHSSYSGMTYISNVYVTGKIVAGASYNGGFFGTTGGDVTITNSFVNVELEAANSDVIMGGIGGRLNNSVTIENVYVAGSANENVYTVAGQQKADVETSDLVIFMTGGKGVTAGPKEIDCEVADATTEAALIAEVKAWPAFSATEEINGYPALNYNLSGEGTEANPYQIASAEDLCNAYRFVNTAANKMFYFVQTADIDMDGIEDYHAINGYNGVYASSINYDGQNHIISNFAPYDKAYDGTVAGTDYYYCTSVFGVCTGVVKNLGVVNAYNDANQGTGILGAYLGHTAATQTPENVIENVFVTGEVVENYNNTYTGGMFGTNATPAVFENCFANVNVTGYNWTAAIIGRTGKNVIASQVYAAGEIIGADGAALMFGSKGAAATLEADAVYCFATGLDAAAAADIVGGDDIEVADDATKDTMIADIQEWDGFSDKLYVDGYPALAAFNYGTAGVIDAAIVGGEAANGPAVYYNLQGVRVANPANGIYIVRRGNTVTKELVK